MGGQHGCPLTRLDPGPSLASPTLADAVGWGCLSSEAFFSMGDGHPQPSEVWVSL